MERWNEPMLEPWEREAAISAILDRGLVPKPGIGLLLRTALNAQVLFFGVVDCIFLSILAAVVLMIPLLAAVFQQASPAPMLFLASPALYALLLDERLGYLTGTDIVMDGGVIASGVSGLSR